MTRLKKFVVSGLLVLVSCFSFLGVAISNFAQSIFSYKSAKAASFNPENTGGGESITQGNVLSVKSIPTSATKGEDLDLLSENKVTVTAADGSAVNDYTLYVEVTNPYGVRITEYNSEETGSGVINATTATTSDVVVDGASIKLNPSASGMYRVKYHVKTNSTWTSTREYTIYVASEVYDMKLITNDSIVMPTTIRIDGTHQGESWAKNKVDIALPLLYDNEGKLIEDQDIILGDKVQINDANYYYVIRYTNLANSTLDSVSPINSVVNTYETYKAYTIKLVSEENASSIQYKLNITINNNTLIYPTEVLTDTAVVYAKNALSFNANPGNNVISYAFYADKNSEQADDYLSYTIKGDAQYNSEDIELIASPASTIRESEASYKQKIYLPAVTATNATDSNTVLPAYYYYTVRAIDSNGIYHSDKDYVVMGKDEGGVYFIPMADPGTRYEIYYNAVDFYGNTVEVDDNNDYEIRIRDRKVPEYYYTSSYDVTDKDSATLDDLSYKIPNKVYTTDENPYELTIPALWAQDESGIEVMTRSIVSSGQTFIDSDKKTRTSSIYVTDNNGSISGSGTNIVSAGFTLPEGYSLLPKYINEGTEEEPNWVLDENTKYILEFDDVPSTSIYYKGSDGLYRKKASEEAEKNEQTDEVIKDTDLRDLLNSLTVTVKLYPAIFGNGSYSLRLQVRDNENNSNTSSRSFSFEVTNSKFDESTPTVKFGNVSVGNVTSEQKISIVAPTAKDSIDTRLLLKYYLVVNTTDSTTYIVVNPDEDGNIVFNMSDKVSTANSEGFCTLGASEGDTLYDLAIRGGSKVDLVAFAYNDYANYEVEIKNYNSEDEAYKGIAKGTYSISVRNTEDSEAPLFAFGTEEEGIQSVQEITATDVVQHEWVEVSGVTFYDNSSTARIFATVTDTLGNDYPVQELSPTMVVEQSTNVGGEGYNYKYTFEGIRFMASNADEGNYYTVTYTLVDDGDNVVSYSFVLVAPQDKTPPVISGIDGGTKENPKTLELGNTLYINDFEITDNKTQNIEDIDFSFEVTNSDGIPFAGACRRDGNSIVFRPTEVGLYTITFVATDKNGNKSDARQIYVEVSDTIKPIVTIQNNNVGKNIEIAESSIGTDDKNKPEYPVVDLPAFTVMDLWPNMDLGTNIPSDITYIATGYITVKYPRAIDGVDEVSFNMDGSLRTDGVENAIEFTRNEDDGTYQFTPKNRGSYTITYHAVDARGNEADTNEDNTITVQVGDSISPEIYLVESFDNLFNPDVHKFVLGEDDTLTINPKARVKDEEGYDSQNIFVWDAVGFDVTNDAEDSDGNISDTEAENNFNYVTVTVSISGPSGNLTRETTDEGYYVYKFTQAGTYTLTLTVEDGAGNNGRLTRTFNVEAKPVNTVDTTTILGTILIVVSAVILAGVVIYFIRGTKMLPKKAKASKPKKQDEKTTDSEEQK